MSSWKWSRGDAHAGRRRNLPLLGVLPVVAPWLSVLVLLVMFHLIGGTLTREKGVIFELPGTGLADGEATGPVAVMMPQDHGTIVFFDDARYFVDDRNSLLQFSDHLAERLRVSERKTLLVLADRRVAGGDLMTVAALARSNGVSRVLFAEKRSVE